MDQWLRRIATIGMSRGVIRGSRPWLVAGMVAIGLRTFRRFTHPAPEVLFRTAVRAGDRFLLSTRAPDVSRRRRRAAR
jgi:hypothetical protein